MLTLSVQCRWTPPPRKEYEDGLVVAGRVQGLAARADRPRQRALLVPVRDLSLRPQARRRRHRNFLLDWAAFRYRWLERIVEPRPLPLIRAGRVLHRNLRAEFITLEELRSHLRQNGIESESEVRLACMESDGNLSVLKFAEGKKQGSRSRRNAGPRT